MSSMLRRIEKVLEQVRQTTCGDVFRSTKGRCKDIFFPERYTVNKENGDCQCIYIYIYELKKEGILLSVETRMSIFRVKLILFALLVTYLCASCHCYWPVVNKFYRHEIYKRETIVRDRPAYLHRQSGWCC